VGVKSRELYAGYRKAGIHTVLLDKGFVRGKGRRAFEYWRVGVNAHHPTRFLETGRSPPGRWIELGLKIEDWRSEGRHVVFAGSSEKYHAFHGLPHPTEYAASVIDALKRHTEREIVYRPKPSWHDATPIDGSRFSLGEEETIGDVLTDAHALVTHGSGACFEAMVRGVPSVILGDAIARPISSTRVRDIEEPFEAPDMRRQRLLWNVAYCQWTLEEFATGTPWLHIERQLHA
jgi:hypothetical protein